MSTHGPQFDEFGAQATHPHNGAEFDTFDAPQAPPSAHGELWEKFPQKKGVDRYGEHWDEFGWTSMPAKHGQNFDSDFSQEAALGGGEHGTWHDVFRGGTQVRYIADGCDYEGTVLNTGADHLIVQSREGERHELHLGQIQGFRAATESGQGDGRKPTATPGNTPAPIKASPAEAPSAHDAKAAGGGRTDLDVDAGQGKVANKTLEDLDVAKTLDELRALAAEG